MRPVPLMIRMKPPTNQRKKTHGTKQSREFPVAAQSPKKPECEPPSNERD